MYKYPYRKLSISEVLCGALEERKKAEGRHGSLTLYVVDILGWYLQGVLARQGQEPVAAPEGALITAAKLERKVVENERRKTG